ncbi:hypothetical protein DFH09DRAFT_1301403 [Mycena vulgaris]|nr:hypothetical protein DFH09DRAFT_1301403 [Mycena vulgaris]
MTPDISSFSFSSPSSTPRFFPHPRPIHPVLFTALTHSAGPPNEWAASKAWRAIIAGGAGAPWYTETYRKRMDLGVGIHPWTTSLSASSGSGYTSSPSALTSRARRLRHWARTAPRSVLTDMKWGGFGSLDFGGDAGGGVKEGGMEGQLRFDLTENARAERLAELRAREDAAERATSRCFGSAACHVLDTDGSRSRPFPSTVDAAWLYGSPGIGAFPVPLPFPARFLGLTYNFLEPTVPLRQVIPSPPFLRCVRAHSAPLPKGAHTVQRTTRAKLPAQSPGNARAVCSNGGTARAPYRAARRSREAAGGFINRRACGLLSVRSAARGRVRRCTKATEPRRARRAGGGRFSGAHKREGAVRQGASATMDSTLVATTTQ